MKLNRLPSLGEKIRAIPSEEWDAAARIVIAQKRQETDIANWLPKLLNGSREFEERTIALVEKQEIERRRL